MKKLIYSLFVGASAMLMASCMEVDNFDEPGAHFTGRIIDVTTGENLLADQGECRVRIWEKSFSLNPEHQDIPVKQDGTFNNTKLFNGTYDIVPQGAWWPADTIRLGIGKKTVTQNFEVTPYLKLFDFQTELVGDSLFMHCRIDAPKKEGLPQIMEIRPYLSLNQFCGAANCISYYNNTAHRVNIMSTWEKLEKLDDGKSKVFTVKAKVKPGYIYFVRMGAKVRDDFEKFNYTEIKEIKVE
ncbi:DUF3823 domain-containing protein [Bacteroides sp. 51]|uniref:DUF3823 domain-containing protein n=1 Tax=Bacteroides sp. 51 TaxID=2302938 RepID=UPI0013D0BEED|nr:DUF3823 domain-containing protein [Bacteroides sp. 51]NDV84050.1 DUF3823 domain-containing protein [Bacteroides sp. 51]